MESRQSISEERAEGGPMPVRRDGSPSPKHTGAAPAGTVDGDPDGSPGDDRALADFTGARPRLFGIAYRILGSVAEADDVLQDAWIRWQAVDHRAVREPAAFLSTMTTRLAINVAQSAHARRETYIGPWLPEPVDTSADPTLGAERNEALEVAVLLLLEKLNPTERAAYVLREAFDYPYDQLAQVLQLTSANVRQLVSRARKHLAEERSTIVSLEDRRLLLVAFLGAARGGDVDTLEQMLAADVVSYSDGGGLARAAKTRALGRPRVANFTPPFAPPFGRDAPASTVESNGSVAARLTKGGVDF